MTQNCRALKQHLEDLMAAGHLREYIDQDKEVAELGNPPPDALKEEIAKAAQIQRIMSVEPVSKKVRTVPKSPLCTVSFTSKDLEGIQHQHTDALIITVGIGKRFDVKRVLVDQGSTADILYYDLFRKLDLSE
ncbi:uncharacterized protein LOC114319231 [Camellia sinensis]|uniref:uncharacterized protein LOC114319231 n=1 Tax=Camellia sinensis TaxID=4442 RepID=UPI001035FAF0|nr:uncharacterized protein LOC114319231 [Camellia sinensis]